jgi:hypothetical protein
MTDLSTAEAARQIGVHIGTLQRWVKEGRVHPKYRLKTARGKGHYRWDLDDLRRQLAGTPHEHEHHAQDPAPEHPRVDTPSAGDAAGRAYEGFKTARRRK